MYKDKFDIILDKDEQVIKTIKPNKKRHLLIPNIINAIILIGLGISLILAGLIPYLIDSINIDGLVPMCTIGGTIILLNIIAIISNIVTYKNKYYAITNKRVIIRSGFIGVDYKSLDLKSIGAINVKVDLLDKIVHPVNTGSIIFGSMSMPMNNNNATQSFGFVHIDNPYDLYREIKGYIDNEKKPTK